MMWIALGLAVWVALALALALLVGKTVKLADQKASQKPGMWLEDNSHEHGSGS